MCCSIDLVPLSCFFFSPNHINVVPNFLVLLHQANYGVRTSPSFCPMDRTVEALKSNQSVALHGTSMPTHGLSSSCHSCHNQRSQRPYQICRRPIRRGRKSFGMLMVGQFTKLCPPFAWSSPFQMKERRNLSTCFHAQAASGKIVRWWVCMEDSTDVTRASRPARFKSRSCYDEMSSVFSRRGWSPICVHVKYAEEPLYIWEYTNTHISLTVLSSSVGAAQFSRSVAAHEFFVGSVCATGGLGSSKGRSREREQLYQC